MSNKQETASRFFLLLRTSHHKMKRVFAGLLLLLTLTGIPTAALASDVLKLLYENRQPLSYRDSEGKLTGLLVIPVTQAFTKAGIEFVWVETPFKRQINLIEKNEEALCAAGIFKNKERQKFAKFSTAVLRDMGRPSVMLAHHNFKPNKSMRLLEALRMPGTRMLKKDSASYGTAIDEAIEHSGVTIVSTTAETLNMAKMIAAHRADFIFVPEDTAMNLIKTIPDGDKLYIFKPQDMPQSPERYLMCSNAVSDTLIQKFNRAIVK
nr:transporter substrate-binding domain-containing protein [uncultured Undibacterium sp.]